jgi:4-diphosphocytidyl-2C-methyl-D-erythritol kinase
VSSLGNDLEEAAIDVSAPLAETARLVRRAGRSTGALHTAMSGSGSSFFLLFHEAAAARAAALALRRAGLKVLRCSFLERTAYLRRFEAIPTA